MCPSSASRSCLYRSSWYCRCADEDSLAIHFLCRCYRYYSMSNVVNNACNKQLPDIDNCLVRHQIHSLQTALSTERHCAYIYQAPSPLRFQETFRDCIQKKSLSQLKVLMDEASSAPFTVTLRYALVFKTCSCCCARSCISSWNCTDE